MVQMQTPVPVPSGIRRRCRHAIAGVYRQHVAAVAVVVAVVSVVLVSACAPGSSTTSATLHGSFSVTGSTALQPLATEAAKLFAQQHSGVHVDVTGGGSFHGLDAVTSHKADIGDSDVYADPAIYPDPTLTDHLVCVVPFSMIVNPDVTGITSLTKAQIVDIFSTGKITNWAQVGGPNLNITPVVRPSSSGTRATFRKYVLGGRDEVGQLLKTDSSTTVRDTVAKTPGAIGYLALAVLDASVHAIGIDGQPASAASIENGKYPFWSYEHMYTLGDDQPVPSAFLDFMLTPQVQQLAQKLSYIPIADMKLARVTAPGSGTLPASEAVAVAVGRREYAHELQ